MNCTLFIDDPIDAETQQQQTIADYCLMLDVMDDEPCPFGDECECATVKGADHA